MFGLTVSSVVDAEDKTHAGSTSPVNQLFGADFSVTDLIRSNLFVMMIIITSSQENRRHHKMRRDEPLK